MDGCMERHHRKGRETGECHALADNTKSFFRQSGQQSFTDSGFRVLLFLSSTLYCAWHFSASKKMTSGAHRITQRRIACIKNRSRTTICFSSGDKCFFSRRNVSACARELCTSMTGRFGCSACSRDRSSILFFLWVSFPQWVIPGTRGSNKSFHNVSRVMACS